MSIRKVSDLPGLARDNSEWNNEDFMKSLIEVSYPNNEGGGNPRYKSKYMNVEEFGTAIAQLLSAQIAQIVEDKINKNFLIR